jgi:hypothetical protein
VIVDLRGNPGGLVWAAERALQLFTDIQIHPTRFSCSPPRCTRRWPRTPSTAWSWRPGAPSLQDSVSTGELYAQPLPLTDPDWCNDKGRSYPGRAVAVVTPIRTPPATCSRRLGRPRHRPAGHRRPGHRAGGANVWTFHQLRDALAATDHPLPAMPEA